MKTQRKKWLEQKLRQLQLLESYSIERTNESVARQLGISPSEIVKLNYNENLFMSREKLVEFMREVAEECDLRIYPQEEENKLKEKISTYLKIPPGCVAVGNGSDELIDRIARLFLEKDDKAVSVTPTFPVFRFCIKRQGAEYVEVPLLKDFGLDVKHLLDAAMPEARLLYLCSPNNPTANQFKKSDITTMTEEFPGVVVLDEAYAEYADYSMVPLVEKYENLIVLRTFSKAFGLAGLRLGYAVANVTLAKILAEKTTLPFPVSVFTLSMGRKLLENFDVVGKTVEKLKVERGTLIKKLNCIRGIEAFDSKTDFVLFNTDKPCEEVYQKLQRQGILIKKFGKILHLENCLRATVGLPQMNAKLLGALGEIF
ncbi:MAG TPA: histidinol-phosphate transaminase [Candidatus Bathyarchaeia archaeon]|nr:histidinol-phosphate transaminase [Candidatus Bathyarchaeia archaeon]